MTTDHEARLRAIAKVVAATDESLAESIDAIAAQLAEERGVAEEVAAEMRRWMSTWKSIIPVNRDTFERWADTLEGGGGDG